MIRVTLTARSKSAFVAGSYFSARAIGADFLDTRLGYSKNAILGEPPAMTWTVETLNEVVIRSLKSCLRICAPAFITSPR
jgi:hypothetical protein